MLILRLLKRLVPRSARRGYHRALAMAANLRYGRPSRHLIVVGVTGTDGKTTTATMIADLLAAGGHRVGLSSSAWFQVGEKRWLNETHMTMPGRFSLQRLLRRMVDAGCEYAVLEVSSEGLAQARHIGIDFDVAVITNLTPEHLEAHGSFERYREAKGLLFRQILRSGDKHVAHLQRKRLTVVNLDDPSAEYFLQFWAEKHIGVTMQPVRSLPEHQPDKLIVLRAERVVSTAAGSTFEADGQVLTLGMPGEYNVMNALEAIAVARAADVSWDVIRPTLAAFRSVPGRMEEVSTGRPWRVIVDYALTPNALEHLYRSLQQAGEKRIIAVFGAAGGGRDVWKRPKLGAIAARFCQQIILTTDDPYDEDPGQIAAAILDGIPADQRQHVTVELDRRAAIRRAMQAAGPGDVIAVTGMGSETSMMVKGKRVAWNDAATVRNLLQHYA